MTKKPLEPMKIILPGLVVLIIAIGLAISLLR
jgi:hypothetical protein